MPSDTTPLAHAERCLDALDRALRTALRPEPVGAGRAQGDGPDARRIRADLAHLRESLALLRASSAPEGSARPRVMVEIPDTPYDPAMWRDADDEGIGCRPC
jgi:hypothetical protein